jgi:hypothetical protein
MTLNWRHKAGLFLTVVAVGSGLYLELSVKQAVGIALIGVAFSWLIGSLTPRVLRVAFAILICAIGLNVGAAPVWSNWESIQTPASEYDLAIGELQSAVKSAACPTEGCIVTVPDSVQNWLRPGQGDWASGERVSFPATMSKAEIMKAFEGKILFPRPTFSLRSAVRAHTWPVFGGLALFASGLSILGWLLRRRRIEQTRLAMTAAGK